MEINNDLLQSLLNEAVVDGDSRCVDVCRRRVARETERILLEAGGPVQGLSIPVGQWHTVNVLEPTVILECKDGAYEPIGEEDMIMTNQGV